MKKFSPITWMVCLWVGLLLLIWIGKRPADRAVERALVQAQSVVAGRDLRSEPTLDPTGEDAGGERLTVAELVASKATVKAKREALLKPVAAGAGLGPDGERFWRVQQGGRMRVLEVAFDELWVEATAGRKGTLRRMVRQPDLGRLVAAAAELQAEELGRVRLVLYPQGVGERTEWNRQLLTDGFLLEWDETEATRGRLLELGLVEMEQPEFAPGLWTARVAGDAAAPLRALAVLEAMPGVRSVEPLLASRKQKRSVPNDPLFSQQWHLRNDGQRGGRRGVDANLVGVWSEYRGEGITIGIVDDGVDLSHPDLAPNVAATGHYDWNGNDDDPSPEVTEDSEDSHGTAVAGVAAARGGNGIGGSGAAPSAKLVGMRLISEPSTDEQEAAAMRHLKNSIEIKNNSWGPPDDPIELGQIGSLTRLALQDAVLTGRDGRGTLFIWAGGNGRGQGDQSNKDAYANSRFVIAVGALTNTGLQSGYSESGANLIVAAPSNGGTAGIVTTDLQGGDGYNLAGKRGQLLDRDYTNDFGGTSSAVPLVAGVAALILEANPNLRVRDVKEIFLRSSVQVVPTSTDWVKRPGGRPDLVPIKHHHGFGGGMVNAAAAVEMAEGWSLLPTALSRELSSSPQIDIPDGRGQLEQRFDFSAGNPMRVETVEVTINLTHTWRGDLEIDLVSPRGVVSRLVTANALDFSSEGFAPWTFSSVRHWGESSAGVWRLIVRDRVSQDSGRLQSVTVRLHGVEEVAPILLSHTQGLMVAEGGTADFAATASGAGQVAFEWRRNGVAVGGSLTGGFSVAAMRQGDAGSYRVAAMTAVGESESVAIPVSVVRVENRTVAGAEGRALTLTAVATGPVPLQYRWRRGGVDLVEGVDGRGTRSRALVLSALSSAMEGDYDCLVSDGVREMSAGVRQVVVALRPVMVAQTLGSAIVSGQPDFAFAADHFPTRFVAKGLPPGMVLNSQTGRLTGRPNRSGRFTILIYAENAAGRSEVQTYELEVEDLPVGTVNTYRGLVERQEALNRRLGGTAQLKVVATGAYSGAMVLGGRRVAFRGRLDTELGSGVASSRVKVVRKGVADLDVAFEIGGSGREITGRMTGGGPEVTWFAKPDYWSTKLRPATDWVGLYNVVLATTGTPVMGTGFIALTVSPSGAVRMVGRSGNAQPFTSNAMLTSEGEVLVSALIDAGRDSLQGVLEVSSAMGPVDEAGKLSGELSWVRVLQPESNRLYRPGFTREVEARGERYVRPVVGSLLMQWQDASMLASGSNGRIGFAGAALVGARVESALAAVLLRLEANHRVFFAPAFTGGNQAAVRMVVNAQTGLVTGGFQMADPNPLGGADLVRRVSYHGLIHGDRAEGMMVLPMLPNAADAVPLLMTRTPIVSGRWLMEANEP